MNLITEMYMRKAGILNETVYELTKEQKKEIKEEARKLIAQGFSGSALNAKLMEKYPKSEKYPPHIHKLICQLASETEKE